MDAGLTRREQATTLTIGPGRWQRTLSQVVLTLLFIGLGIGFLIPFYWMALSSIRSPERIFVDASKLFPTEATFTSYQNLFAEINYRQWYLNSIVVAFGFAIVAVTVCTLAAYPLARLNFPLRNTIFFSILASQMLPFHLLLIPLFIMMVNFKMIDTYLGVILPLAAHPFGLFYMRQYMLSLSPEILDAARVDGASEYQVFLRVVLPLVRPAIGTLSILFSLEGWNDLLWPLIVLRNDEKFTLTVGIAGLLGIYRPRWDLVITASFLATFPIIILFLFMQRQFIAGISSLGTGVEK